MTYSDQIHVDLSTGQVTRQPLTAAEIARRDTDRDKAIAKSLVEEAIDQRRDQARITAVNIPDYAVWTQADFQTWFDSNLSNRQIDAVSNLAETQVVMRKMSTVIEALGTMVLALRDQNWPDLTE